MTGAKLLLAALASLAMACCAGVPTAVETSVEEPGEPPTEPAATSTERPSAEAATAASTEGAGSAASAGDSSGEAFSVTAEVYEKTFAEIEEILLVLSDIIEAQDFDMWRAWLTPEYVARTSSPEFLAEVSEGPVLKKAGIKVRDLREYFTYVVVPSRSKAKLDRLDFVDATHVKAVTLVGGQPYILWWLVRSEGRWKIGIW